MDLQRKQGTRQIELTTKVSLIDSDELVNLIIHCYDNFDAEARSLLTLRKIYWPE